MKKIRVRSLVWIVILALLIWFFRPFFHGFYMLFVVSPLKGILVIALIAGIAMLMKKFGKLTFVPVGMQNYTIKASNHVSPGIVTAYIGILLLIIVALNFESEIRYLLTAKDVQYETKTDLPTFEPIRLTPKQVAKRYADDTFQNPQEMLGDSQIVMLDGKLKRVFPRLPDGGILYFTNKLTGFVTVEVDTLEKKVDIEVQEFKYAEGIGVFDNLYYRLKLKKYSVDYTAEPVYLKNDKGEWVTVVSYIGYKGFPFRVPYWAGVMEAKSDGTITDYTPEQAQQVSYFKNNRLYPKELVNYFTDSYSYKGGLLNKWFLHKNQTETVALPGSEKIFHVSTNEGFKQLVVAEPYGRSYGVYKIFIFDATTGKREIVEYDQNSQLTGPVAAADYIKREFPTYSWDAFNLAEPRPLKIGKDLYWLLSIIPNDAAGIAKTVLFDAKTNKVIAFDNSSDLTKFIATGVVATTSSNATSSTAQIGTVTDKNAEINAKIESIQKDLDSLKTLLK
jgi:hypothetical protein